MEALLFPPRWLVGENTYCTLNRRFTGMRFISRTKPMEAVIRDCAAMTECVLLRDETD
jgi:hypothetical protein